MFYILKLFTQYEHLILSSLILGFRLRTSKTCKKVCLPASVVILLVPVQVPVDRELDPVAHIDVLRAADVIGRVSGHLNRPKSIN